MVKELLFPHKSADAPCITVFIHGTQRFVKLIPRSLKKIYDRIVHKDGFYNIEELPSSYYYRSMMQTMQEGSPSLFQSKHLYVFCWPGTLHHEARTKAAHDLNTYLKNLTDHYKTHYKSYTLTIITHSHGGNVALNLAAFANEHSYHIDTLILLAAPVQVTTETFVNHALFKKIYALHSHWDLLQVLDPQKLYATSNQSKTFFSKRHYDNSSVMHISIIDSKIGINRGITHVEFLLSRFMKQLGTIITTAPIQNSTQSDFIFDLNTQQFQQ